MTIISKALMKSGHKGSESLQDDSKSAPGPEQDAPVMPDDAEASAPSSSAQEDEGYDSPYLEGLRERSASRHARRRTRRVAFWTIAFFVVGTGAVSIGYFANSGAEGSGLVSGWWSSYRQWASRTASPAPDSAPATDAMTGLKTPNPMLAEAPASSAEEEAPGLSNETPPRSEADEAPTGEAEPDPSASRESSPPSSLPSSPPSSGETSPKSAEKESETIAPAPIVITEPEDPVFKPLTPPPKTRTTWQDYTLEGILWSPDNPERSGALINDRTMGPGDRIGDMILLEVLENYVIIEINGFKYELRPGGTLRAESALPPLN